MPALSADDERYIWLMENRPSAPIKALIERREASDTLLALAEHAPSTYLEILWPWYEQCLKALRERTDHLPGLPAYALDREANFRFAQDQTMRLSEPTLLGGLRIAAELLAEDNPDQCSPGSGSSARSRWHRFSDSSRTALPTHQSGSLRRHLSSCSKTRVSTSSDRSSA